MAQIQFLVFKYILITSILNQATHADATETNKISSKIVGGLVARKGQFPYQVSLQFSYLNFLPYQHICGGSILTSNWILTAGHCVFHNPTSGSFRIKAGITNLDDNQQTIKVDKLVPHPEYDSTISQKDIALVKLEKPLNFNDFVGSVKLPDAGSIPIGLAVVSGWGSSEGAEPETKDLMFTRVPLLSNFRCVLTFNFFPLLDVPSVSRESNICTGSWWRDNGPCTGDSGGPLVQDGAVIGIVSWGIVPCGTKGAPSVYTKVSNYIEFIRNIIGGP